MTNKPNARHAKFLGVVTSRSSKSIQGPPGEKVILELNPQRLERILEITGWPRVEPGTLNLSVDHAVLDCLLYPPAVLIEKADSVMYPEPWKHIPTIRKAYLYYDATAHSKGKKCPVLVRRAENPVPGRMELFADRDLRDFLAVNDGDVLEIELANPDDLLDSMRRSWEGERRFFSSDGKEERERWVATEFLSRLGIEFELSEVISPEQAHSTDIEFRAAQFQIKEILDPTERRHGEIKDIHKRVQQAKTLADTIGPAFAYDMPKNVHGDTLIYNAIVGISNDPRYFPSKPNTDLLFYVTHARASLPNTWTRDWTALLQFGWRSISCLIRDHALILFVAPTAPEFLRNAFRSRSQLVHPYGR